MSKNNINGKKIAIESFFTEKQLNKFKKIRETSSDVAEACDRFEELLKGTKFKVLDAGTNREIWQHKKLENVVFKIAADKHGVEANYREFYISSLDKRLTDTYSISEDGAVIVQEKVERLTTNKAEKYRKDIRKMLDKLSEKILCVDCQLKNHKNFGIRKLPNGKSMFVLLDYGDCVPLPDYQDFNEQVNFSEEINCSLKCRSVVTERGTAEKKRCKGTLKPNKNYDMLICSDCGRAFTFDQAYREFILDEFKKKKIKKVDCDLTEAESSYKQWEKQHNMEYAMESMKYATNADLGMSEDEEISDKPVTLNMDNYIYSADGYAFDKTKFTSVIKKSMLRKVESEQITGEYFILEVLKEDPINYAINLEEKTAPDVITEEEDDWDNYESYEPDDYDDESNDEDDNNDDISNSDDDNLNFVDDGLEYTDNEEGSNNEDTMETEEENGVEYVEEVKVTDDEILMLIDSDEELRNKVISHLGLNSNNVVKENDDRLLTINDLISQSSVENVANNIFRHKELNAEVTDLLLALDDTIKKLEPGEIVARPGTDICNFVNSAGYLLTTLGSLETIRGILIKCDDNGTSVEINPYKQIVDNASSIVESAKNVMSESTFKLADN